jgi:DNA ligase-1
MKPMLACDWDETKLKFPLLVQPKIDGVRALNMDGRLTARSLKPFKNRYINELFSGQDFVGLDGEFTAQRVTHPDLCRLTTSAVGTIEGRPFIQWWLFDWIVPATRNMPYEERYEQLERRLGYLQANDPFCAQHLRLVPQWTVENRTMLESADAHFLSEGYEGTIIRAPNGLHKMGRSTTREGGLLRIKRFLDEEAVVIDFLEGNENGNEAQINELGKTFRTSHQENMIPNGQVGTIIARRGDSSEVIHVSPGNMPVDERRLVWSARASYIGKVFTFKHFPKGVKDKPRFPTWKFWRDPVDL